ncbi:hypothetical protein AXF42_Ash004516 [Apostasia shenzhenica]|uniref:Uncharacterized protein n=1 Tax=Apostasia shenzhenica TaxID=1088818 RepID=A0A2I0BGV2_9ASPA|nr:hypothetical protein AXF42_Ash004516 [Apostasia shenzhenica]
MASRSINIHSPLPRPPKTFSSQNSQISSCRFDAAKNTISGSRMIVCSALQESSTATVSDKKEEAAAKAAPLPAKEAPPKPKKAPAKPLPEMMEEDVIPSLRAALEAQGELSQIDLSFKNNTVI